MPAPKREGIMLCATPNPTNLQRISLNGGGERLLVQRKLNGERCRVEWFHGEPVLISSYGNIFNLPHIKEALTKIELKEPWDGELYRHGWIREKIHSVCSASRKELHPEFQDLEFHIFDTQQENVPQYNRIALVKSLVDCSPHIKVVETEVIPFNAWLQKTVEYMTEGYEGIIIRNFFANYVKKRTTDILKFKPTEQDEYTIDGCEEAISKDGELKGMIGAFWVHGDDGTTFKVGAGKMKHPERISWWEKREDLPGKTLIVKHEMLKTKNDVPVSAVAVEVKG